MSIPIESVTCVTAFRAERVLRGIKLLDEQRPGWRRNFHPDTLNLRSSDDCVLGQLYGSFVMGCICLGLGVEGAIKNGFALEPTAWNTSFAAEQYDKDYDQLTETWRQLVH